MAAAGSSGGEQQMLTSGRALMTNPALVIFSEATESVAPQIAIEIWSIIGNIRQVVRAGTSADRLAHLEILHQHLGV
ncbi:MAG TPA: hypothetical protein VI565_03985 [Burkholderiales bacterium]|nr:hypothetical protein [Burkholderiales bacterium]